MIENFLMILRMIKYGFMRSKKADMSTKQIITILIALTLLLTMYLYYKGLLPIGSGTAAGKKITKILRIDPFG